MTGKEASEEMESVSHELLDDKSELDDAERGGSPAPAGVFSGLNNLAQLLFSPIFMQTFGLAFCFINASHDFLGRVG
jgi:hypothetical protein